MLTREQRNDSTASGDERPAEDEIGHTDATPSEVSRFGGARFGNAMHAALEDADFAAGATGTPMRRPPSPRASKPHCMTRATAAKRISCQGRALLTALIAAT